MSREGSEVGSDGEEENVNREGTLEDNLELLGEKRSTDREKALAFIIKDMRMHYQLSFAEKNKMTLLESFKRGLKRGAVKEQTLTATALNLLAITMGADAEEIYKEMNSTLLEVISNTQSDETKAAVLNTLSILLFVGNPDEQTTIASLEIFSKIFSAMEGRPIVQTAAMRAWAFLVTTVSSNHVHSILLPEHLQTFVTYLQSEDVELRVAAGECIALLFEIAREEEGEDFAMSDIGGYASVDVDELLNTLYSLSSDKTKQRAKKDKIKQKIPFKEIVNTVETGESPIETLSFKFQKFDFDSWHKIIQLNTLRDTLAQGLQTHFESNDLIQEIFNIRLDKEAVKQTLSQTEKRMMFSPNSPLSKARTKNMALLRNNRGNRKMQIMEDQ
eukprot:TRINITY_DN6705_c0_g1_i1.p1 TRINITY_DN6705_c0_g1~~TRINITY_DN6705_c0_g1_i1.p1  ORF type:complete len:388 (+),score=103.05 TRINITY_DN6705_c0_g1_i1:84-1247(+)